MQTIASGIFLLPGFLSRATCEDVVVRAEQEVHWVKAYVGHYKDDQLIGRRLDLEARDVEVGELPSHFDSYVHDFAAKVSQSISLSMGVSGLVVEDFMLSRYAPGCHIKPHSDTGVYSTSRVVTAVQYLNEAYAGGEIFFPQLGVSVQPRCGDLLLFWSEYEHGVAQITDGVRYALVSFGKAPKTFRLGGH